MGLKIGATTSYQTPSGVTIDVEVTDVQTYNG